MPEKSPLYLVVIIDVEEEDDGLHGGIHPIEVDGDDFVVQSVVAVCVTVEIIAGVVQRAVQ